MARLFKWHFKEPSVPNKAYGGIYGAEAAGKSPDDVRNKRADNAANSFAEAEKNASASAPKNEENTTSSSSDVAENGAAANHTPHYSDNMPSNESAVAAAKSVMKGDVKGAVKNMFSRSNSGSRVPLFSIGGLTAIIGILMMLVSGTLPIHLISNFGDLRNTMFTQNNGRTNTLIRRLTGGEVEDSIFSKRTRMGDRKIRQMNRGMNDAGFKFEYDSSSRRYVMQAAQIDSETGAIKRLPNGEVDFTGSRQITSEVELKNLFDGDQKFRVAWNDGTKTMTGKNSGWFGSAMAYMLRKNGLTRNLFKGFIGKQDARATLEATHERLESAEQVQTRDQLTEATRTTEEVETEDGVSRTPVDDVQVKQKRFEDIKTKINNDIRVKAAQMATGVVAGYCAVKMAVAAVSAVYAMEEAMRAVAVVAGYFEAGQKTLAGDGDDSYHAFGDMLNTATVTKAFDENENEIELNDGVKFSPTEARGMQAVLVGGITASSGENDMSVMKYHMEKATSSIQTTAAEVQNCAIAIAAAAVVNMAIFAAQVIVGIATLGIGAALIEVGKIAGREAGEALIMNLGLGLILKKIVPMIALGAVTAIATEVWGEDFGNMVGSFGSRYYSKGHQGNGGPAATYDTALAFYREQQTVLAYAAELDRATLSPFDITNSNTFLGKISSNLAIAGAGSSKSILGQLGTLGGFASSMRLPTNVNAAAMQEIEFRNTINWTSGGENGCERLASIGANNGGAVGDMFCNPIRSNDLSTAVYDPEFVYWKTAYTCDGDKCSFGTGGTRKHADGTAVTREDYEAAKNRSGTNPDGSSWSVSDPNAKCSETRGACNGSWYEITQINVNSNGLEKVNGESELAKMIKWGVDRQTDPGIMDANIVQEESGGSTGSDFWDSVLGAIPLVGDIMDTFRAFGQSAAVENGWADGTAFCAGCGFKKWESNYKYLNQYIVDTNIYENIGAIDKSPTIAYLEEEVWPFEDRSYEGVLASNLGVPKEYVVSTLAFAEDLKASPSDVESLIASAPNIYSTYYGGQTYSDLEVQERDEPCNELDSMRECTQIAGNEWRRRFNSEATA
jgi:hypothetical protein